MDLAVGLELINEPGKALKLYHELSTRLSSVLNEIAHRKEGEGQRERVWSKGGGCGQREEGGDCA